MNNNTFINCKSSSGGALFIIIDPFISFSTNILDSNFINNTADIGPSIRILGFNLMIP